MQTDIQNLQFNSRVDCDAGGFRIGSGGWIRTIDLRVMSPTSCHCSTPRQALGDWRLEIIVLQSAICNLQVGWVHGPTLPADIPPVPSALPRFTTRFGMGRGGATALLAHLWLRGQCPGNCFWSCSATRSQS